MNITRYTVPSRGINPIIHLFFTAAGRYPRRPILGLSASSVNQAHYLGAGDPHPRPFKLTRGPAEESDCGFWEIDLQLMPGVYAMQIPSSMRAWGYTFIHLRFPGAQPHYLELHGVEFNPYDSFALGLTTWVRSNCHEHLTSGLRRSMPATLRPLLEDWFNRDLMEE